MTTERRRLEKAATAAERPLWQLSRDEQRALIITFVGGLASILVGAVVIGGAVALAHYEQKGQSLSDLAVLTGVSILLTALSAALVLVSVLSKRRPLGKLRPFRLIWTVLGAICILLVISSALLLCALILTWIGIVAGIH